ncbi:sugar transferase [Meridianimarinicoccus roseus]|uniref:Sugar transferase n=1 Tax=Meridianimarinicoccus roseus TaxID=2072018 RepID=A0A2V2LHI3_9RHOB|nr:sugar transferase [Meridianimarinicoccus roseus]PWR04402.1 sugar transferase [Meridianimarinicoccus roseus]
MTAHFSNSPNVISELVDYTPRACIYRDVFKRAFDILFVVFSAILVLPVVLILAILVMMDGGSPFYIQSRVGRDGKLFSMLKLRSMVRDADRKLADYLASNPEAAREWETTQKLRRDPRVTFVGSVIRRTSLDELPQFWNVLVGDMSVVGPRPMMPSQRELYPGQAYYALRPGVTGLWQVGDRNNTSFASRAKYDAEYYRIVGFFSDMAIVLKTVRVMLRGTGV